jgi:hypothetical protein
MLLNFDSILFRKVARTEHRFYRPTALTDDHGADFCEQRTPGSKNPFIEGVPSEAADILRA